MIRITVGYGDDQLEGELSRHNGWFGGASLSLNSHVSDMIDYDTKYLSEGVQTSWCGFEAHGCLLDGNSYTFHVGYISTLLPDKQYY